MAKSPVIDLYFQCDMTGVPEEWLSEKSKLAVAECLLHPGTEDPVLPELEEIEVTLVTDETIAQVHGEFMDDPTPTDVITFHHGEILVSVDTARSVAEEHGNSVPEETFLYIIHGLLHLNGHTDLNEPERTEMHRIQEEILAKLIA